MWELQAGFFLGCLYVLALYWATREVDKIHNSDGTPVVTLETRIKHGIRQERYRGVSLILTVASLLYILFRGGSCLIGGLLGFYDPSKIDQYSWPVGRIVIFAPIAVLIVGIAFTKMRRHVRLAQTRDSQTFQVQNLHENMTSLIVAITVVGIATIWPSKIGVLYAALLWVAMFAMNRLGYHYDSIRSVTED
jgi:Ca2+/Na+ antiporter